MHRNNAFKYITGVTEKPKINFFFKMAKEVVDVVHKLNFIIFLGKNVKKGVSGGILSALTLQL